MEGSKETAFGPDGAEVGDIPDLMDTHGATIANEFDHGFTSNRGLDSVTMFDLKTLAVIKDIRSRIS